MSFFDKDALAKIIPKKVTATFKILEIGEVAEAYAYVVLLDIEEKPPLAVAVDLTPKYMAQAKQWNYGMLIKATIKSEISSFAEKAELYGWDKEICKKVLRETGYSWGSAITKFYFVGKISYKHLDDPINM